MTHLHTHTHNNSLTEPSSSCHIAAMIPTYHHSIITLGGTYGASLSEFETPTRAWPTVSPSAERRCRSRESTDWLTGYRQLEKHRLFGDRTMRTQ